jgi:UDP-hydrolysing UDP-N-acetyl-D-glucosamine 2-epimerase
MLGEYALHMPSGAMDSKTRLSRRLAVVSSSRADMSHLIWPLRAFAQEPSLHVTVFACGAALSNEYGRSADRLRAEGFETIDIGEPLGIDTPAQFAVAIGRLTSAFAGALEAHNPDLLMVIADRAEMLAPATAALTMRIPIIHVEGGERSEGAIDDAVRNALTKMSHVHFVTTEEALMRVAAIGEEPWRIHHVGAASLDHLRHTSLPDSHVTLTELGFDPAAPLLVVSIHPTTLAADPLADGDAVLQSLHTLSCDICPQVLLAFPNADYSGRALRELCAHAVQTLKNRGITSRLTVQLQPEAWFCILLHPQARAIVGNSSSVVMESPATGLPAVLVGDRQAGRAIASSTCSTSADPESIAHAIRSAMQTPRAAPWSIPQPYGDGNAGQRMAAIIRALPDKQLLLRKTVAVPSIGLDSVCR